MFNLQGVSRLVNRVISAAKSVLPRNAARAQARAQQAVQLGKNQALYAVMEQRLSAFSADNPAQSPDYLFTLNRMEAFQKAILEILEASSASAGDLATCRDQIAAINQQRTLVYGKIREQLESTPNRALAAIVGEGTIPDAELLGLLKDARPRIFDRFRLADTLAAEDASFADRATSEMKTAIWAGRMVEGLSQHITARASTAQQHQLAIVPILPAQETSIVLAEAA